MHGTVNDLAMCGARPQYLSVAFIVEEGLPMADFRRIIQSMQAAATRRAFCSSPGTPKLSIAVKPISFSSTPLALV